VVSAEWKPKEGWNPGEAQKEDDDEWVGGWVNWPQDVAHSISCAHIAVSSVNKCNKRNKGLTELIVCLAGFPVLDLYIGHVFKPGSLPRLSCFASRSCDVYAKTKQHPTWRWVESYYSGKVLKIRGELFCQLSVCVCLFCSALLCFPIVTLSLSVILCDLFWGLKDWSFPDAANLFRHVIGIVPIPSLRLKLILVANLLSRQVRFSIEAGGRLIFWGASIRISWRHWHTHTNTPIHNKHSSAFIFIPHQHTLMHLDNGGCKY